MMVIGCDYHPVGNRFVGWRQPRGDAGEKAGTQQRGGRTVLPGSSGTGTDRMESTGNCQWFVEMVTTLGHDLWIGDAAKIRASDVRQQKHDRRDAELILKMLLEGRFPRIWTPSGEEKDLRQLLIHRYKLVRIRAQVKNELQHLAMNQGVTKQRKLWSKAGEKVLRELPLKPWASRRREDLLKVRGMLDEQIGLLDAAVVEAAEKNEKARREYSSGGHQRLGSISKQGNRFMRMLLVEAAQGAVRYDPGFRNEYLHRCHKKAKGVAKVAAARKLAVRLYWMLRTNTGYPEVVRVESSSRVPLVSAS